jgi:hypothetical protein
MGYPFFFEQSIILVERTTVSWDVVVVVVVDDWVAFFFCPQTVEKSLSCPHQQNEIAMRLASLRTKAFS